METYRNLQEIYSGYFRLIDLRLDNFIHLTFSNEFIRTYQKRRILFRKREKIRDKQYKISYSRYGHIYDEFQKFISIKN